MNSRSESLHSIAAWLRELGLESYAQAFAEHDVDAQTLLQLTDADLVEIGVKSVGHRRRLIDAIGALKTGGAPQPIPAETPVRPGAEHRKLSVLCCDMVGSTGLSERLDAEDLREVIRAFHEAGTRTIVEFDGHEANFIGDCMLAYFGWPRAHEDDPERAVRAGLAMVRVLGGLRVPGGAVAVRVSVATGDVVVGDLIQEGPAREQSAIGTAPLVSAQLQSLAAPGQVVIDDLTRQLLPPSFALQALGHHALKGVSEPVAAYAVIGERLADSRFEARRVHDLAPMLGREHELALLRERWAQAQGGEGQAVLLVGEAGIGKSRLTRALLDVCASQPHVAVRWQCSPYHAGSALWPVIQRLGRAAGLDSQDSTEQALDKLEALTQQNMETTALYATMLGLNGAQRYGPLEMTPQRLREHTLELLMQQLYEMAEQQTLLLVLEDAHWVDPTTLELIERCLERIDGARMLILLTSRLDNQPKLAAHPSVTRLSLNRLSRACVEAIVVRLGGQGLHAHTLATIVAQTDGVPLFVEELTKAVLQTGGTAIPASLHGSLMARLDRIPEVKEVAQIAACIGREFDQALLEAVVDRPEAVGQALERLIAAELVFRRGGRTPPRFTFKHALVQEAAYESVLRGRRQVIHARILEALETIKGGTPAELRAHHAERAKQVDKAIACWTQAADAALAKWAYTEAAGHLEHAISLIRLDSVDRRTEELRLQLRLGHANAAVRGNAEDSVGTAFERASELLDDDPARAEHHMEVQAGLWAWHMMRGRLGEALRRALRALDAANIDGRSDAILYGHWMVSATYLIAGRLTRARDHIERTLALHDDTRPWSISVSIGADPRTASHYGMAWILFLQGYAVQARRMLERSHLLASSLPRGKDRANMHLISALCGACVRDVALVKTHTEALAELSKSYGLLTHHVDSLVGWIAMEDHGSPHEAVAAYERGIAESAALGSRAYAVFFRGGLARALAATGRHAQALRTIEEVIHDCAEMGIGWCEAELWRIRGEVIIGDPQGDRHQAISSFERALSIARDCGAKLWELRAAVSLARLWATQGERAKTRDLLAPIYGWFTEGFESVDLVEARALMSESSHASFT